MSRYDGTTWRTYTTADGLASRQVLAMLADRSGSLWFCTDAGASRYDGVNWRTLTTANGLANNLVFASFEDRLGNLWFGTDGGVSRYDQESWRTYTTADGLAANDVAAIIEGRSRNLWFGTSAGVTRFDRSSWRTYTTADGLLSSYVVAILEDRSGGLWFGTYGGGVSRFDGTSWRTFTTADGLLWNNVWSIFEDRSGNLWFGTDAGVSRYDGSAWRSYTPADGLAIDAVTAILQDRAGIFWFGTYGGGVSRFNGSSWRTYTMADGLANNTVVGIVEDSSGNLWFGTFGGGVSRFDGSNWKTFTPADGLTSNLVAKTLVDHHGGLWFGTYSQGVSRLAGERWRTFTTVDGLANNRIGAMFEDQGGDLWFGTHGGGVSVYSPDRVAARAVPVVGPPPVTSARTLTLGFLPAFGEARVEFSYALDGGMFSTWSGINSWTGENLADGVHTFVMRARDELGNADPDPPKIRFEVDATPPLPVITAPVFRQAIRDSAIIAGTAADARLKEYRVEFRPDPGGSVGPTLLARSSSPVADGVLAGWNTSSLPDGDYELRLSVTDTLGLTATALTTVIVDNHAPYAEITTPAKINAAAGGDVWTTDAGAHLYFPPHGFSEDAVVTIATTDDAEVPATLPDGAARVLGGGHVSWVSGQLKKAATFELSYAGVSPPSPGTLALYASENGAAWTRLGGSVDARARRISAPLSEAGRYALFAGGAYASSAGTLSMLALTPRVFSPRGTFANRDVGIGFSLGRAGPVTVRIYNRAGRLVREVASGVSMGAGANLVRWDGLDRDDAEVEDGLYLVTVEALGEKLERTLAVVR